MEYYRGFICFDIEGDDDDRYNLKADLNAVLAELLAKYGDKKADGVFAVRNKRKPSPGRLEAEKLRIAPQHTKEYRNKK